MQTKNDIMTILQNPRIKRLDWRATSYTGLYLGVYFVPNLSNLPAPSIGMRSAFFNSTDNLAEGRGLFQSM